MAKVLRTDLAERDIERLWLHYARYSVLYAERLLVAIERSQRTLAAFPDCGAEVIELGTGIRRLVVMGDVLVFYRHLAGEVRMLRVLHAKQYITAKMLRASR